MTHEQPELPGMPGPKSPYQKWQDGEITYDEYFDRRSQERYQRTLDQIREYSPDDNPHVYASYVPNRNGQLWKVHSSLKNARSATTRDMGGIYKRILGHWEIMEIRQGGQTIEEFE